MSARLNRDGTITYRGRSGEWIEAAREIPLADVLAAGTAPDVPDLRGLLLRAGWRFDLARRVWTIRPSPLDHLAGGIKA